MFDHTHYVPVVRWKAGEKRAMHGISGRQKASMTPLIEWSRPGEVEPDEDREVATPAPRKLAEDLLKHWGARPFFFDPSEFWSGKLGHDSRILRQYTSELKTMGLRPIPVLRLGDDEPYRAALRSLTADQGVCVRLRYDDLQGNALGQRLDAFSVTTAHGREEIHLVADFDVHYADVDLAALCARVPEIARYRTFTVAAGSFPQDLREFKGPQIFYLAREEWIRWHDQVDRPLVRRPTFGDYMTLNPLLTTGKAGINPSATIRYTTEDHWLVMKGEGLRSKGSPGSEQYPANAQLLLERPDYCGADFSEGDCYIRDVAIRVTGPGNPTSWVQAGVGHHVAFVVRQLEALFDDGHHGASTGRDTMSEDFDDARGRGEDQS